MQKIWTAININIVKTLRENEDDLFSGLNLDEGKQIYRLPADFNPAAYDEVTIWCDKFNAFLAEAKY